MRFLDGDGARESEHVSHATNNLFYINRIASMSRPDDREPVEQNTIAPGDV